MISTVEFTYCDCLTPVVADDVNARQVSEGSGEESGEEFFGKGQFVLPEPRGIEPQAQPKRHTKSHTLYSIDYFDSLTTQCAPLCLYSLCYSWGKSVSQLPRLQ